MRPGRRQEQQKSMWLLYDQLPQSLGHVVYKRLQKLLYEEGVDSFPEKLCAPFYAEKTGRRSIPPGSLWGYCRGHCLVLAQQKAGPLLEPD